MPPTPDSHTSPLEALALAYQRLMELTEVGHWEEIEALAEEIGALCDLARQVPPQALTAPELETATQYIVNLQPVLECRLALQLQELQSLLAAARNTSRIQQNYGSTF